jgi:hypothetical protein
VIIIAINERYKISFWNENFKMKMLVKKNSKLPDKLLVLQIFKTGKTFPEIDASESENVIIKMETSVILSGNNRIKKEAIIINNVAPVIQPPFS